MPYFENLVKIYPVDSTVNVVQPPNTGTIDLTLQASDTSTNTLVIKNSSGTSVTAFDFAGKLGIGNTAPGALLDIGTTGTLGTMRLEGNTSGYVQIQPAAAAGSWTLTLPVNDGNANQVLTTDGNGITSWTTASGGTTWTTQASANSVLSLTSSSTSGQIFTGTTAGQRINLPDATTLTLGYQFMIINNSDSLIPVYLNDGTTLLAYLYPDTQLDLTVIDISSSNGIWVAELSPQRYSESNLFDDFIRPGTATNTIGNLGWASTGSNNGGVYTQQSATTARIGVMRAATTTDNSSAYSMNLGTTSPVFLTNGRISWETYMQLTATGGTGASAFTVQVGLIDTTGTGDVTNGVYFEYAGTAAGTINWSAKTASASTRTTTSTGVAAAATTWIKFAFVVNAGGTNVDYYVNNALTASITTNIPTTGLAPAYRLFTNATNSTARSIDIDYFIFKKTLTTVR